MTLGELRDELSEFDQELFRLIGERQKVVAKIGALKRREGIATRDFVRERQVQDANRLAAARHGVSESLARDISLRLIEESLTVQEQARIKSQTHGQDKKVLVVGGHGQMGVWLVHLLSSQGFETHVFDKVERETSLRQFSDWETIEDIYDIILVATPIATTNDVLLELARRKYSASIIDVASIKSPLRTGINAVKQAGLKVSSLHPMFGPSTMLLSGRHVICVDVGSVEANEVAKSLFASTMATVVQMSLEDHDRLIAYVLGLSHAVNIAFSATLFDCGEAAKRLARLSSTTFDAQLLVARRVAEESPELYFEIQSLNDYGMESLTALSDAVEKIRSAVRASDLEAFTSMMKKGRSYFAHDTHQ